jgi:hypothetical protein
MTAFGKLVVATTADQVRCCTGWPNGRSPTAFPRRSSGPDDARGPRAARALRRGALATASLEIADHVTALLTVG